MTDLNIPPMTRRERILAAVRRQPVDRVPYAFWRHFPTVDRSSAGLAQATLRFHERYGGDLLVLTPRTGAAVEAWGCVESDEVRPDGSRSCARCAVVQPEDWRAIRALDPAAAPGYVEQLETIVRVGFDRRVGDAPVVATVYSPLALAARLGSGRLGEGARAAPAAFADALQALAETTVRFGELCLAEGLAGLFYVVGTAEETGLDALTGAELAESHDRTILAALRGRAALLIVHAAGAAAPFEALAALPADAVSWDAGRRGPALADGHARVSGAVLGGLDAWTTLRAGTPEAAAAAARDAVARTAGRGLVVAPGGVVPPNTPDEVLVAIVRALGGAPTPVLGVTR